MEKNINMSITMKVQGTEGMNISLSYENTDLKTVVMVQQALLKSFQEILNGQAKQLENA